MTLGGAEKRREVCFVLNKVKPDMVFICESKKEDINHLPAQKPKLIFTYFTIESGKLYEKFNKSIRSCRATIPLVPQSLLNFLISRTCLASSRLFVIVLFTAQIKFGINENNLAPVFIRNVYP